MNDSEMTRKILSLLKRGPFLTTEIQKWCQPYAPLDVLAAMDELEADRRVFYSVATGLWYIVDAG